jgi:hypothetical protein
MILVGGLMIATLGSFVWCLFRLFRWVARPTSGMTGTQRVDEKPIPYGGLPGIGGPVGPIGGISPNADINIGSPDSHDLFGD